MHDQLDLLHRRLEQSPDDPECLLALGQEYARVGQNDRAIAHLDLLTRQEPDWASAWVQLAACQHRARDLNAARHSLEQALATANAAGDHDAADAAASLARQLGEA